MLTEQQIRKIKAMRNVDGLSVNKIAKRVGVSYATARKYALLSTGENVPRYSDRKRKPEEHRETIESFIRYNKEAETGKQWLTIERMYSLIEDTHGPLNYTVRTLQRYVKDVLKYKKDLAFVPLQHDAGCAQIDFGTDHAYINGEQREIKHLVVNFPHSGRNITVALPSENRECLLWGLVRIFEYIGGVPRVIRIDNASTMVDRGKEYPLNEFFEKFSVHYGFKVERCNPASGHEKGCVERGVDTTRKSLLSPIPVIDNFERFNDRLLRNSERLMKGKRYGTEQSKKELWNDDLSALKPLPVIEYHPVRWEVRHTDKSGIVSVDTHRYSTSSHTANTLVHVKVGAFNVEIYDRGMKFVVSHKRCYYGTGSIDLTTYEDSFVRSPRALYGSGISTEEEAKEVASVSKDERKPLVRALLMKKYRNRVTEYAVENGHYNKAFQGVVRRGYDMPASEVKQRSP